MARGISIDQMTDQNGVYLPGSDDLQQNPIHYFNMSRPTKHIKAFISHTWDAKDFNPRTVGADRKSHATRHRKPL